MYIVVAPQALKGSLDAQGVGEAIADGIRRVWPDATIHVVPVADGGEGTVTALVAATNGTLHRVQVTGPLGAPIDATFGMLTSPPAPPSGPLALHALVAHSESDASRTSLPLGGGSDMKSAVIEMAEASGLPLVPIPRRNPLLATTYGTGELIRAALDAGAQRLLIGIGGSATNDGGAGMAQALGARLLDAQDTDLPAGGAALARLARIDVSGLDPRLAGVEVRVACDVTNPLCGLEGASAIYGPQKGATPAMVRELDAALAHYADVLKRDLGVDVADVPGAGAAGGLGAGLLAFAHAQLVPGATLVLEALGFAQIVQGADIVFTAEGRLDQQTAYGKAVGAVAVAARQAGARVVALAGRVSASDETLAALGIDAALSIVNGPMSLARSIANTRTLLTEAAARAARLIELGMEI